MKLTSKLLAAMSLGALFIGCGPDLVETSNGDAQTKGSVQFIITDSETGDLLDSVKVENVINGKNTVVYSDSGISYFGGLENSEYQFLLSKTGYASMWQGVDLQIENDDSDAPRLYDQKPNVQMYELGAEVTGKVYYTDKDGNQQAAVDAQIELSVSSAFQVKLYSATADEDGVYTISNLPENVTYSIKVLKYTDAEGAVYTTNTTSLSGIKSGETKTIPSIAVTLDAKPFSVIQNNLSKIKSTESVIVTFSEAIDENEIELDDINVSTGGNVAVKVTLSSDKKTVTIAPVSGSWKINATHYVSIDVTSTEGKDVSFNSSFMVKSEGDLGDVSYYEYIAGGDTNTINSDNGSATLYWAKLANADSYEIYRKDYNDSAFVIYDDGITATKDTVSATVYFGDELEKGRQVQFLIVGVNGKNRSAFDTAEIITLKDNEVAEVTGTTIPTSIVGIDRVGFLSFESGVFNVYFDDSMNLNKTATLTLNSAVSSLFTLEQEWVNSTQLRIKLITKAGVDSSIATGTLTISLANLTDEAGNKVNSADDNYSVAINPVP